MFVCHIKLLCLIEVCDAIVILQTSSMNSCMRIKLRTWKYTTRADLIRYHVLVNTHQSGPCEKADTWEKEAVSVSKLATFPREATAWKDGAASGVGGGGVITGNVSKDAWGSAHGCLCRLPACCRAGVHCHFVLGDGVLPTALHNPYKLFGGADTE